MIDLYCGTPGSGKSLHIAEIIKKWITIKGAPVIVNYDFNVMPFTSKKYGSILIVNNQELIPDFLIEFSEQYKNYRKVNSLPEDHILLVIDECQLLFNAREWQHGKNRGEWISFFTQHRKLGYHVILVAQHDRMIDRQIRAVIEYEFIHRKVKNIGRGGKILNFLMGGNVHVIVKIYKPLNEKVGSEFFHGNKELFALYNSYTTFDSV